VECITDSHPYRITSIKCRIITVVSPDDGHTVTQNICRKEINILRKIVHPVGFIYNVIYWFNVSSGSVLMVRLFLLVGTMWNWAVLTLFWRNIPPYSGYKGEGTVNTDAVPVYQIT